MSVKKTVQYKAILLKFLSPVFITIRSMKLTAEIEPGSADEENNCSANYIHKFTTMTISKLKPYRTYLSNMDSPTDTQG